MKAKRKFWHAKLDTRNFSFDAYGETEEAAREGMLATLREHAGVYPISFDLLLEEYLDSIEFHERRIGAGYRDAEQIWPQDD